MKKRLFYLFLLLTLLLTVFCGCNDKNEEEPGDEPAVVEETPPVRYVSSEGDVLDFYVQDDRFYRFYLVTSAGTTYAGSVTGKGKALILTTETGDMYVSLDGSNTFSIIGMSDSGKIDPIQPVSCAHAETKVVGYLEPTCEKDGYSGDEICISCGTVLQKGAVMTAKGHNFKAESDVVFRKGYCTDNEKRYYACTVCGKVSVDPDDTYEVPNTANGKHTYTAVSDEVFQEATCADNRINYACCAVCGQVSHDVTIEVEGTATGLHDFSAPSTMYYIEPDCGHNAVYYYSCSVCGLVSINPADTYVVENTMTGTHSFTEPSGIVKTAATCVSDRVEYARCAVCGCVDQDTGIVVSGTATGIHSFTDFSDIEASPATCTSDRYVYSRCEYCGYVSFKHTKRVLATAHAHTYVDYICTECHASIDPDYYMTGDVPANENVDDVRFYLYPRNNVYDLVLFGSGKVKSYVSSDDVPWRRVAGFIEKVYVYGAITRIGDYVLSEMPSLKEVVFTSDVTQFGNYAFYHCTGLQQISLPVSTQKLGYGAFAYCTALSSLNWTSLTNLTSIGKNVFRGDTALTAADLSATQLTAVPQEAFSECWNFASVSFPNTLTTIDAYGFYETAITSLSLPSSVGTIGAYAFSQCTYLTSVTVASLSSIGDYAFAGDSILSAFSVPTGAAHIGKGILDGTEYYRTQKNWTDGGTLSVGDESGKYYLLYGLAEAAYFIVQPEVGSNPHEAGWYRETEKGYVATEDVFCRGGKQYYEYKPEEERYLPVSVSEGDVPVNKGWYEKEVVYTEASENVPSSGVSYFHRSEPFVGTLNCSSTTSVIASGAFERCEGISIIVGQSALKVIGENAFAYCLGLLSVQPGGIVSIEDGAFRNCAKLTTMDLPASLTSIGEYAFYHCTLLRSLTVRSEVSIPASAMDDVMLFEIYRPSTNVSSYGALVVRNNDYSAASVVKSDGTFVYAKVNDVAYLIGCLTPEATSITLPASLYFGTETVTSYRLHDRAFYYGSTFNCLLRTVTLPSSVVAIGKEAFLDCAQLASIRMSLNVTEIGEGALDGTAYNNNENNRQNGFLYLTASERENDEDRYFLLDVRPGLGVSLETSTVKENTVLIADGAFSGCVGVKTLTLPTTLRYMGRNCLGDCTEIRTLRTPFIGRTPTTENYLAYYFGGTGYADNATLTPSSLVSLTVTTTETIQSNALNGCVNLKTISFTRANTFGDYALNGCTGANIVIEGAIVSVGRGAFKDCVGLTEVAFSSDATTISQEAFYGTGVRAIVLQGSMNSIGVRAFAENPYLYDVVLGDAVNSIGVEAFAGCVGLLKVTIGTGMPGTGIGTDAFRGCYKLVEIYNKSTVSENPLSLTIGGTDNGGIARYAHNVTRTNSTIIATNGDFRMMMQMVSATQKEYYLLGYVGTESSVTLPSSYNDMVADNYHIYQYAFAHNKKLTRIVMPAKIANIGVYAFYGCENLTQVSFSQVAKRIDTCAFEGSGLTSVDFPSSVTTISERAFAECADLATVSFGAELRVIGDNAFLNCVSLESLSFPSALNTIGQSAFRGCSSVRSVLIRNNLTSLGQYAFKDCVVLNTVDWSTSSLSLTAASGVFDNAGTASTGITVSFGAVTAVPAYLFCAYNVNAGVAPKVTSVSFGNAVISRIGEYAFYGASFTFFNLPVTLREIGSYAFAECRRLTTVTLPDAVTTVGRNAFSGCVNLSSFTLSNRLTTISEYMFSGCIGLRTLYLPSSITRISSGAFNGCSVLSGLALHNELANIDQQAFAGCSALTSVYVVASSSFSATIASGNEQFNAAEKRYVYFDPTSFEMFVRSRGQSELMLVRQSGARFNPLSVTYLSSDENKVHADYTSGLLLAGDTAGSATITATITLVSGLQVSLSYNVIIS